MKFFITTIAILFLTSDFAYSQQELSISEIQQSTDSKGESTYKDQIVIISGQVTYADEHGYCVQDGQGAWNGIYAFDHNHRPEIGDQVKIKGKIEEYFSFTEITDVEMIARESGQLTIAPAKISPNDAKSEAYESVLIEIENAEIVRENTQTKVPSFEISSGGGNLMVGDRVRYRFAPKISGKKYTIRGVVWYTWEDFYLMPRGDSDILGREIRDFSLKGKVLTPNGLMENYFVKILDDKIDYVGPDSPGGAIHEVDGIIMPGLIDAHNHPSYNNFPTLNFNSGLFQNRYQWRGSAEYDQWKDKRSQIRSAVKENETARISKWAEILELTSGCVAIQGNYSDREYAHPAIILYNVEQFPSRAFAEINAAGMDSADVVHLKSAIEGGKINAAIVHLSEGVDQSSIDEFYKWKDDFGLLNSTTAIIHGVPYGASEFQAMANAGAKLIWSPMSNIRLYNQTANIALAKEKGVTIALAPDWTPSGRFTLLQEIEFAWQLNQSKFNNVLTAKDIFEMVTINAAKACGLDNLYGTIETGKKASIAVFGEKGETPYHSIIESSPEDVRLVLIDGVPQFGDPDVMEKFGFTQIVEMKGQDTPYEKVFNVAVDHPLVPYSEETVEKIRTELRNAHNQLQHNHTLTENELFFLDFFWVADEQDFYPPFQGYEPFSNIPNEGTAKFKIGQEATVELNVPNFWDNYTPTENIEVTFEIVPKDSTYSAREYILVSKEKTNAVIKNNIIPNFYPVPDKKYVFSIITSDEAGNTLRNTYLDLELEFEPGPVSVPESELNQIILENHPNPFTETTNINFKLNESSAVEISIFDMQGNLISTVLKDFYQQGSHAVRFDASRLPAGVYYCVLKSSGSESVRKMIRIN